MALNIDKRFVTNFGPINVEVISGTTTDETSVSFNSELSRVEGGISFARDNTTNNVVVSAIHADGKSPSVTLHPRLTGTGSAAVTIMLFGY